MIAIRRFDIFAFTQARQRCRAVSYSARGVVVVICGLAGGRLSG